MNTKNNAQPYPQFYRGANSVFVAACGYFLFSKTFLLIYHSIIRSGRLFKMAIVVMSQPGFWSDSMHSRVLILTGSL